MNRIGETFMDICSSRHYTAKVLNTKQAAELAPIDFSSNNTENYDSVFNIREFETTVKQIKKGICWTGWNT